MIAPPLSYFPFSFTRKSIVVFFGVLGFCLLFFASRKLPVQSILFNCVEVIGFFYFTNRFTKKWGHLSPKIFRKKLLLTSFVIRLVWVLFSYFFFKAITGKPFEFEAGDSIGYHIEANWLSLLLQSHKWAEYRAYVGKNFADMGYPFYLGILYYVVGTNIVIARLIKALLGSYVSLFVYRITQNNFGESTGRIAAIMTMLLPNLIYYCGLHVKETEMIFLSTLFIYLADKLIRANSFKLSNILLLSLVATCLFYFRTVLAGCLIGSVVVTVLFSSSRITALHKRIALVVLVIGGIFIILQTPIADDIYEHIEASDKNQVSQMQSFSTRNDGSNRFARYGSRSVFLPFMLMAPFPTLIDTQQPNAMMLGGAYFTRNVYAFFVFIALFALYKRKRLRYHILLLAIVFSYIFVLSSSGFALSERFHLPLVPFLLILAAYGITQMNQKNKKYYFPYLMLVAAIVIGWNWFKIAGRT